MKTIATFTAVLLAVFTAGHASADQGGEDLAAELATVEHYAFGGVGFAGTTSKGELLYDKVIAMDDAEAIFCKAFEAGTPAAKAYALHGLKKLESEKYADLKDKFVEEKFQVMTMSGCIASRVSPAQAVAMIEKRIAGK